MNLTGTENGIENTIVVVVVVMIVGIAIVVVADMTLLHWTHNHCPHLPLLKDAQSAHSALL